MLILLLIVSFRKRIFISLPFKLSLPFTLCSFSATKLIHFVSILKKIKTFRFCFFVEHFKFIEAYHILLTICKAESIFMTQIVRKRKTIKISVFIFLYISANRRTFATEIKQIVIEIFERLAKSQISKEIRHER